MSQVIQNRDLIIVAKQTDIESDVVSKLDPEKVSVVGFNMLHNDAAEVRADMFLALKDRETPFVTLVTFPLSVFNNITQEYKENA